MQIRIKIPTRYHLTAKRVVFNFIVFVLYGVVEKLYLLQIIFAKASTKFCNKNNRGHSRSRSAPNVSYYGRSPYVFEVCGVAKRAPL